MHPAIISRVLGILLVLYSIALLPPVLVSLLYKDKTHFAFLMTMGITLSTGIVLWLLAYKKKQDLRTRDGFVVTALFWTVLGLFGSLIVTAHLPFLNSRIVWFFAVHVFTLTKSIFHRCCF